MFKIVNGFLCDEKGNQIKDAEGKEMQVQDLFDSMLNSRLGKERGDNEKLTKRIEELTTQLEAAVKPEEKKNLEARIEELTQQLETKEQTASRQATKRIADLEAERDQAVQGHKDIEQKLLTYQLNSSIGEAATANRFKKADYLRMSLTDKVIWEDELGTDGKPTGNKVHLFKLQVPKADGKGTEEKLLNIQEAAAAIAKAEPDFIMGTGTQGSGNQGHPAGNGGGQPAGLAAIYKT